MIEIFSRFVSLDYWSGHGYNRNKKILIMKKCIYSLIVLVLISCNLNFSGTLGGGQTYRYECSEEKLNVYLDSIEKYDSSLKVPEKWKEYDNWDSKGYDFLKGKIFYIKGNNNNGDNDEMYYVSVIPPIKDIHKNPGVAIRSVFRVKKYLLGWKRFEDFSKSEKNEKEEKFKNRVLVKIPLSVISVDED